jgi:uncharacterized membrane protein
VRTLVQILVAAVVLLMVSTLIIFMYSDEIGGIGNSATDLVNNTACQQAQEKYDQGDIDELPDRCKTGLRPEPPKISAT